MYNTQQIVVSKEAALELKEAMEWSSHLESAVGKAVLDGDLELAHKLFIEHEDALLNIRMVMRMNGLPVPPLKAKVKLPF